LQSTSVILAGFCSLSPDVLLRMELQLQDDKCRKLEAQAARAREQAEITGIDSKLEFVRALRSGQPLGLRS
jgi:hypothetical protein